MTELIERVAKAMCAELARQDYSNFQLSPDLTIEFIDQASVDFAAVARAAIEAMREPTDAMILAGARYYDDNWRPTHAREDTNAEVIWQDMIDAGLSEEKP